MQIDTHSHTHTAQHSTHGKTFTIRFSDFFPPRNKIVDGWISLLILRSRARPHTRVHKTTNIIGGFEIEISDTRRRGNHLTGHSNDHVVKSRSINVACGETNFQVFQLATLTQLQALHDTLRKSRTSWFCFFLNSLILLWGLLSGCYIFLNRWSLVGKAEERGDDTCEANDIQLGTEDQGRDGGKVKAPFFHFSLPNPQDHPPWRGGVGRGRSRDFLVAFSNVAPVLLLLLPPSRFLKWRRAPSLGGGGGRL